MSSENPHTAGGVLEPSQYRLTLLYPGGAWRRPSRHEIKREAVAAALGYVVRQIIPGIIVSLVSFYSVWRLLLALFSTTAVFPSTLTPVSDFFVFAHHLGCAALRPLLFLHCVSMP